MKKLDEDNYLFYANGISNSVLENIPRHNFEIKEIEAIAKKQKDKKFIYFSTSQVNSAANHDRAYVKHKVHLEKLIIQHFPHYLIIRTTNLVGNNPWNTHTLFNYLYHAITVNQQITVNPVLMRNFLDAAHLSTLLRAYLCRKEGNEIIEIVNPVSYNMQQIISEFEHFFKKKFNLELVSDQNDFAVFEMDTRLSVDLFTECHISTNDYIPHLMEKYYASSPVTKAAI